MKSILTSAILASVYSPIAFAAPDAAGSGAKTDAKPAAAAETKNSGYKLVFKREATADEKFGPQQQVIYDAMKKYGVGKEVDRSKVLDDLEKGGLIKTRQPVDRILAYYLNPFKKMGIIDSIAPAKVEKPAKEAKPAKTAASPANAETKPAK